MVEINVQYDSSVTNLQTTNSTLYSEFTSGVASAVQALDQLFTGSTTVTIDVGYGEVDGKALGSTDLGESVRNTVTASYSAVRSALIGENAPGSSTLPTTSPDQGTLVLSLAQAKALGLQTNNGSLDGYVGFSSSSSFSYSAGVTPSSSAFYFVGVVEHEITEVMGRASLVNDQPNEYSLMDLYRYTSSGTRDLTASNQAGATAYFSINNGATNLGTWNNVTGNGDLGDWYPSGPAPNGDDAFNDFSGPGVINEISPDDVTLMDALGWSNGLPATTVSSVMVQPSSGAYRTGTTLAIALEMSGVVAVSGTPSLSLNDGGTAVYNAAASTSTSLVFDYTVAAGQNTAALAVTGVNLNGATVTDTNGNAANLSGAATTFTGLEIDTTAPSLTHDGKLGAPTHTTVVISASALQFDDNLSSHAQETYTIVSGPSHGQLLLNGAPTTSFTQAQLDAGSVSYDETAVGVTSDSFSFTVSDAAGNTTGVDQFNLLIPPPPSDLIGNGTSDIVWRDNANGDVGYWRMNGGHVQAWVDLGGSGTAYQIIGTGNLNGGGTADILWFDAANGDTGYWRMNSGSIQAWVDLGSAPSGYQVIGAADLGGDGADDDILLRNTTTGNTAYWHLSGTSSVTFTQLGGTNPAYQLVGTGDLTGNGTDDVVWTDTATRDTGYWQINSGSVQSWVDLGATPSGYQAVGLGDLFGNGTNEILLRNATTGDTGYWKVNGSSVTFQDLGGSSPSYQIVGTGDYLGNGTDDILWRNATTGDTGYWQMASGHIVNWVDIGGSSPAYHVA